MKLIHSLVNRRSFDIATKFLSKLVMEAFDSVADTGSHVTRNDLLQNLNLPISAPFIKWASALQNLLSAGKLEITADNTYAKVAQLERRKLPPIKRKPLILYGNH